MSSSTAVSSSSKGAGIRSYYQGKIDALRLISEDKTVDLRRLEAQRNDLNTRVRRLRDEIARLQEPGSYVGEVVKVMGKNKVLVKVHPEGKYVVNAAAAIDLTIGRAGHARGAS